MHFIASSKLFENEVLLKHFMEHSYWIKELNRNPNVLRDFEREMKVIYKERPTDKLNNVVDGIEMLSSFIEMVK